MRKPTGETRNRTLFIYVLEKEYQKLVGMANKAGAPISTYVRNIIQKHLETK